MPQVQERPLFTMSDVVAQAVLLALRAEGFFVQEDSVRQNDGGFTLWAEDRQFTVSVNEEVR